MEKGTAGFGKAEHLCGVTTINTLFEKGRSVNLRLFRIVYLVSDSEPQRPPARMLISIPKRNFKKAVIRNLLKRRIREAYRKNKSELLNAMNEKSNRVDFAIIWTGKQVASYDEITDNIREMVKRLSTQNKPIRS